MANPNSNINPVNPLGPTQMITTATTLEGAPAATERLYPLQGPDPAGTTPNEVAEMEREANDSPSTGPGIAGEEAVWEARYSMKNFVGRIVLRSVLTVAWLVLVGFTWGGGYEDLAPITIGLGIVLGVVWLMLVYRIMQARFGHDYRLTNRRLFVSTGWMHRRRDQMELLRVKDVFTRQTLVERWMSLGTVVVVSSEKELPTFYITGVGDPKQVMDLIWHHARAERDHRSTNIHSV